MVDKPGHVLACARVEALLRDLQLEGLDRKAVLAGGISALVNESIRYHGPLATAGWLIETPALVAKEAGETLGIGGHA